MALSDVSVNRTVARARLLLWAIPLLACADGVAAERYRILPGDSDLRVLVFRSGSLATLAHNHVISSSALTGTVVAAASPSDSSFDLLLAVDSLVVDDPELRAAEGSAFSAVVSEKDKAGTRRNMMGRKLLQVDQFPEIRVMSQRVSGDYPEILIEAEVTITGKRHVVELPAIVARYGDRIVITGSTEISHSDLGLKPLTAALGTMRVGEKMILKYRIVAMRRDGRANRHETTGGGVSSRQRALSVA